MKDIRIEKLAYNLVNYSCRLKKGENVLIKVYGEGEERSLVMAIIQEVYKVGANPFVWNHDPEIMRELLKKCNEEQIKTWAESDLMLMKKMDAYIGVWGGNNNAENSSIKEENYKIYEKLYLDPVHMHQRVKNTKWVVLNYPTSSMAQQASMSTDEFEDFYFKVCNLDYSKMDKGMDNLVSLMNKTDKVKIIGEGTNLEFSIKNIPAIKCAGIMNIPDGEVFTAPVRDSINGVLSYNTPSLYSDGFTYENIKLEFKNGKIVNASANDNERINKIFDTDEGARYIGEFAIGVNPYITKPMKDTLFDEKIMGSFHFTPGACYDEAPNGNKSTIHWDLVCIQTKEYGGGEMYFDDVLIRKDGIFVIDELKCLNPENLI
ncbi:aminopeptidase [Brachyspira pilosicoli]|uniref:Aminopeptidase n=1 Tax=Brachyspira pilosicoli TaxID=52584 RepID=A0AAJ6GFN2_BRAPL|nr:aminopeptidase [Brachyspira pilosicoli]WIH90948.1 aminopeptidase [Brachyspira pilosicoli]WIH93239.1 aminopeptidase [Brachyspira pilosicoli]WIH95529.1 aminopeptidase [Brachyspira pilosicoli]